MRGIPALTRLLVGGAARQIVSYADEIDADLIVIGSRGLGSLEGAPFDEYRAYKRAHTRKDKFPDGESLDDAAHRYADAFEKTLELDAEQVFICCHEIPLRYALSGATGSDQLDGPVHELRNATPYLFTEDALSRAVERIRMVAA